MSDRGMASGQLTTFPFAVAVERVVHSLSRRWLFALILYGSVATTLPIAAPLFKSIGLAFISSPIYFVYGFICHQHPERSFHLSGEQMAFCVRDLAMFTGALLIAIFYAVSRRVVTVTASSVWIVVIAVLPIAIDGLTQLAGLRESNSQLRIATGLVFSVGLGWYLLPRLDAGFRSLEIDTASSKDGLNDTPQLDSASKNVHQA